MKTVLKILKWVGIFIILLLVISLFLPKKYYVERSNVINADVSKIFPLVIDLHKWNSWSPWYEMDTTAKMEFQNGGIGKGVSYTWESNNKNVGKGKMEIVDVVPNSKVATVLYFDGMGSSKANFDFFPQGANTKVVWSFECNTDDAPVLMRPISKYMGFFMDGMLGPDFEKGLKKLNEIAVKN